jgi:hypothetical protein
MGGPINYSDADRGGDLVPNGADRYFPVVIDEAPLLTGDYWRRFSPVLAIRRDFHHCGGGPTAVRYWRLPRQRRARTGCALGLRYWAGRRIISWTLTTSFFEQGA